MIIVSHNIAATLATAAMNEACVLGPSSFFFSHMIMTHSRARFSHINDAVLVSLFSVVCPLKRWHINERLWLISCFLVRA